MKEGHWLLRVVRRERIAGTDQLEIAPAVPTAEAWRVVTRQLGITDDQLAGYVADYFRLQTAPLQRAEAHAAALLPEALIRRHLILPLEETDRHLVVATADPTDVEAERVVGFRSGRTPVFRIAPPSAIQDAIDQRFSPNRAVQGILGTLDGDVEDSVRLVEDASPELISEEDATATPVVKLTNLILRDGIVLGASDIHIEPGRTIGAVRYRVDGVLRKHMDLPMAPLNRVISRIKILSKLDIADRLRPQDGKARVQIRNQVYDLRVSTIPAGGAEKCVLRILDSNRLFTLEDLALPKPELARLRQLMAVRDGVVVVTGPTGSGKTTTLYGVLRELAQGTVNIMTVEDPIEYELSSITQTQVEVKQGVTFASALRAILRQDPDIILVGEIRDKETAEVAAQAALTGHLVLATVHANDAVGAVTRLADLGLDYSTIASAVRGCVAQRLLRRVCPHCVRRLAPDQIDDEERMLASRYGVAPTVRAVGCSECGQTGYRGRLPVLEVLSIGLRMQEAIELRKGQATLTHLATQGGMRPMHTVGLEWVAQGLTTLEEVERVLGQGMEDQDIDEPSAPPRILLVDDDDADRTMMRALLEGSGAQVQEVADGQEAMDLLKRDAAWSLIVLDLAMPRMRGREVLERVRGAADTRAIPVLVRTGEGDEALETELLEAGADDYVHKTADAARFLARVRAVLRRSAL
ncbi:MAG: ATPase, T2SS/T4P/T4SS family [Gemmatimonadota bacterium]|nr:Flp pilus assembly complex ATPase component TadA [Gemmatimonadota bacterium]